MKLGRIVVTIMMYSLPIFAQQESRSHDHSTISQKASDWRILYSTMKGLPSPLSSTGGWYFNMPVYDDISVPCWNSRKCSYVGYLLTPFTGPITLGQTLTLKVRMTGVNPVFRYQTNPDNTCSTPAGIHLLLENIKDDFSGQGPAEFYRWWSNPLGYILNADGVTYTVQVPISPEQWSSVYGKEGNDPDPNALAGFLDTLAHMGNIGFTFGGGCFFGHGVFLQSGAAQFQMILLALN